MLPPQSSRINVADFKSLIYQKLGTDRAQRYLSYLNRLLAQKLSKSAFDKLCLETLGRENLHLHNQFICSILKNASQAKVPPTTIQNESKLRSHKLVERECSLKDDVLHPCLTVKSNGAIQSPSSLKCGSTNCKIKFQPSPQLPNGDIHVFAHKSLVPSDVAVIKENGNLIAGNYEQAGLEETPRKKQRIEKPLPHNQVSVHSNVSVKLVENSSVKQTEGLQSDRHPLQAPLGIPFCSASIGGSRHSAPFPPCSAVLDFASCRDGGELYNTEVLRRQMEQIAMAQGLEGVTIDCANVLNNGLDAYLKQLIRSCVDLMGRKSGHISIKDPVIKQQSHGKILNGIRTGNHMHIENGVEHLESSQEVNSHYPVSMLDFRVAMELKPQQLGEDWPLLLEKVYFQCFEK